MSNDETLTTTRPDQIDNYVDFFMETNGSLLCKLSYKLYGTNSTSVLKSFQETIRDALNHAYEKFLEKKNSYEYLDKYLFGAIHWKVKAIGSQAKATKIQCPGCNYNRTHEILVATSNGWACRNCIKTYEDSNVDWEKKLASVFMIHSSVGYRCPSCRRFIPQNGQEAVICPYPDCCFAGKTTSLFKMPHPRINVSCPEILTGGLSGISAEAPCLTQVDEEIHIYYQVVKDTIIEQQRMLEYTAWSSTYLNKWCAYQAFLNLLENDQEEMVIYLAKLGPHSRKQRTQIKLLQEFTKVIESKIPFSFERAGNTFEVNSLTDPNLNLFDGESVFKAKVNEQNEIPNMTEEYYIGGRTGKYCLPYYIGKLLDVIDIKTGQSLMADVEEYSFVDIKMKKSIEIGAEVEVKHYRLVPHYGIGTLSTINRIKKAISDRVQMKLGKNA